MMFLFNGVPSFQLEVRFRFFFLRNKNPKPSHTKKPQQEWPEWRSMATRIFGLSCFQLGFVYFMKGDMGTDILTTLAQKKTRTS